MRHLILAIVVQLFIGLCPICSVYAEEEPVKASLVANTESVTPGGSFLLGVHFEIKPGWHIYGQTAGDFGLPTRIEFALPAGFEADELIWPETSEFEMPGAGKSNGYHGAIEISAKVTAPRSGVPEGGVLLKANVSWLNCSPTICIPAKKTLELRLNS